MSNKEAHYFVLSSPSGGGKTTLLRSLLKDRPDLSLSVSYTTRPPRQNEREGVDYYFVSKPVFEQKIADHELLEWEEVHGYLYGTPKEQAQKNARSVLFDVDIKGAIRLKKLHAKTTLIFIQPPSLEILEDRLKERGTEDPEDLKRRLDRFRLEMAEKDKFDYVIINDDVARAVAELKTIIESEEMSA